MLTRFILDSGAKFLKSLVCHNILIFNTKIFCRQKIAFRNFHFEAYVTSLFCLDINFGWKIHFKWYVFFFLTVYVYVDQVQWPNNEIHKKLGASNDENKSDRHFVGTFPHNIPVECMKMQSLGKNKLIHKQSDTWIKCCPKITKTTYHTLYPLNGMFNNLRIKIIINNSQYSYLVHAIHRASVFRFIIRTCINLAIVPHTFHIQRSIIKGGIKSIALCTYFKLYWLSKWKWNEEPLFIICLH